MDEDATKINFPCRYPIKVLGRAGESFHSTVLAVFEQHASGFDRTDIQVKSSRNGTFQSITIVIEAHSEAQLKVLHAALMETGMVSMVM